MRILVINGPNLNLLGSRQPEIYGSTTLQDIEERVVARAAETGIEVRCFQSNVEGQTLEFLQTEGRDADGIIINAGAWTHTSLALRDAFESIQRPFVEVHISNIYAREEFRHHSVLAGIAVGQISGLGWRGYIAALDALVGMLKERGG
ncbi:MAG: type II 3-dehydroquinate dehydratase [Chloroflexi bacterium]|nr:MAG: type II 3-dehydroquinate dehydratase [Chloroflexota bacterium]